MASGLLGLLGSGGLSMLPGLLSHLLGGDPQKKYRQRVAGLLAPQNMSKLTNGYYQNNLGSPGYAQAQNAIGAGANASQNNLMANLGSRGLGTSGTGAILSSLMPSLVGSQMAGLRTGAYNAAQGQAQGNIEQQLKALQETQGPSQTQQMFGGGLAAFGPMLQAFLQHHAANGGMNGYPGYNANGVQNQLQPQQPTPRYG